MLTKPLMLGLALALAAACSQEPSSRSDADAAVGDAATQGDASGTDGAGTTDGGCDACLPAGKVDIKGGLTVTVKADVVVTLAPPSGGAEVQLSAMPNLEGAAWQPVKPELTVTLEDEGYVMIFARFRDAEGNRSKISAAGVFHDPHHDAATAAGLQVSEAYPVRGDILVLRVDAGRAIRPGQEDYNFSSPPAGDEVKGDEVYRNGKKYGLRVAKLDRIWRYEELLGQKLDTAWADKTDSYTVSSSDDAAFSGGLKPTKVSRKSKPKGKADTPSGAGWAAVHWIYLELPKPLKSGKSYSVSFAGSKIASRTLAFDEHETRSGAVHVSHLGFRPADQPKVGYLSQWMGSGGPVSYQAGLDWNLVDAKSGKTVQSGKTKLTRNTSDTNRSEGNRGNLTLTDVYQMDFSSVKTAGRYRLCVRGIGCSFPFRIHEQLTWRKALIWVARGLYHQRSGIALGSGHTAIERPRPYHPDDGMQVFHSAVPLAKTGNGLAGGGNFDELRKNKTDQVVKEAWGGHFDAGDWDRRIQHLQMTRLLLELHELHPDYVAGLSLNIPESGDAVPDLLDEGLWSLDCYRRMQSADGGVRGGVEAWEHPKKPEGSWQESLTVMAYAPGVWSSYVYAGVAARAALVLDKLAPSRAQQYRDSAIKAMKWADKQPSPGFTDTITAARSLAAAELYRLTGDSSWHQVFLDTTKLKGGAVKDINCGSDPHCHAAFVYARTKQPDVKTDVQNNARDTITGSADQLLAEQQKTAFRWTLDHPWVPIMWGMGPSVPKTVAILRAHALTGKAAYLEAATLTAQYTLGANPSGACFVTGLGRQNAHNPLIADFKYGGLPVYPGIPLYGMYDHRGIKQGDSLWWMVQWFHQPAGTFPGVETGKWPVLESHFDLYNLVPQSEFTVQQTSGPAAYAFGYLAAVKR